MYIPSSAVRKELIELIGTKLVAPHHNPHFDFDEIVLEHGYNCYTKIVTDLLKN